MLPPRSVLAVLALAVAALPAVAACYQSHELTVGDASLLPSGDLPEGVVYDMAGRFREVILTDAPLDCGAVRYTAPDTTGSVETMVPRWMSLVVWTASPPSYFLHTTTSNIGPGPTTVSIPDAYGPGRIPVGTRIPVTWSADVVTVGRLGGTSLPVYCGVISTR